MPTGFERIVSDRQLQDHWIRRLIAVIIDYIIVLIATWLLTIIFLLPLIFQAVAAGKPFHFPWWCSNWLVLPFIVGVLYILYSSFAESSLGWTIGKRAVSLKATTVNGQPVVVSRTFVRNVSKIHLLLLVLDVVVGLALPGDPHQKYMDRIAGTIVVSIVPQTPATPPSPPTSPPL